MKTRMATASKDCVRNFAAIPVYATKMDVTEQQWQIYKFSEEISIFES